MVVEFKRVGKSGLGRKAGLLEEDGVDKNYDGISQTRC